MIIYSVTINIEDDVQEDWLQWMKNTHIPDVMNTGYFIDHKISRVISHQPDNEGTSYNIQYSCEKMADLHQYQTNKAPKLQAEHNERFKDKFVAFRTLLETVE